MKTIKCLILIIGLISITNSYSQVGIGTTSPDDSSVLDVVSTNKGLLIPRVSLANIATTMLDGTNTAATGLLIYNTNASVIGGKGVGYYYFNGTIWEQLSTSSTSNDHDFYREGSTIASNNINNDIYTLGNVAIGKGIANYPMDIYNNTTERGLNITLAGTDSNPIYGIHSAISNSGNNWHYGMFNELSGVGNGNRIGVRNTILSNGVGIYFGTQNLIGGTGGGLKYGTWNDISNTGHTAHIGTSNNLSGTGTGSQTGIRNNILNTGDGTHYGIHSVLDSPGSGTHYGVYNQLIGTGDSTQYGVRNVISNTGNSSHIGTSNSLSGSGTGFKYGSRNYISDTAGGTHFGVYSSALKAGSFAGYFLGRVLIGTSLADYYIFPSSRGTNNQVMQTDGAGNVNWADPTTVGTDNQNISGSGLAGTNLTIGIEDGTSETVDLASLNDHDWYEEGTINTPNDINDDIFTQGNVAIGKTTADYTLDIESDGTRGINILMDQPVNSTVYGQYNDIANTGTGSRVGLYNKLTEPSGGSKSGITNEISNTGNTWQYGMDNSFQGTSYGPIYGVRNFIDNSGSGLHYGIENYLQGPGNGTQSGVTNFIQNMGNGVHYGMFSLLAGPGTGIQYGVENVISNTGTGIHYGTKSLLNGAGSGNKYGTHNIINASAGGDHYGVYSEVLKAGVTNFAGYFLGNVSIGTTAANNYLLPASRGTANQVMQTDSSGNLSWIDSPIINNASNGLSINTNDVVLGGTLTQATTIIQSTNNLTFNLNNSGDFNIEGNTEPNLFYADGGTDRIGVLTNAPEFDLHLVQPNTFIAGSSGIGFSTGANNWKIFHSGLHFSFVENGVRRAYVEGGTGTYVVTSDRRLKKNITAVESVLDKVNTLKAYRYLYKDQENSGKKILGFMAQDVEPLFPELVGQAEDGYFALNYAGFSVVAVKAIQEQQDIINTQQQQIEALQNSEAETSQLLSSLLKRIETLEKQD